MGLFGFRSRKGEDKGRGAAAGSNVSWQDPVCHMSVEPGKEAGTSVHAGTTYHFCSAACKGRFDRDPHQYLGAHAH